MAEVKMEVTVTVPDNEIDTHGNVIGTEAYSVLNDRLADIYAEQGFGRKQSGERESVQLFARRMLVCYTACARDGVRVSDIKFRTASKKMRRS